MERRKILSIMSSMLVAMFMMKMMVASDPQKMPTQQREERRYGSRHGQDGRHERRRRDGREKQQRSHVHKWRGHREQQGKPGKAQEGGWKNRWHGGRGFEKHASHMWHKYGWFWDEKTKSWYQCTPIDDPQRGYGCEYNGTWYPMKKSEPSMQKQPQTMPVIKEAVKEDEEDVIAPEEAGDGEEAIVEESYAS